MEKKEITVMICDDSSLIRKKVKDILTAYDCGKIIEVKNGKEAVEQYKANTPDLVLMDIVMPIMTGIEAVEEIMDFDPDAKIVMISSTGTKVNLRDALSAGAYDFIQKPVEEQTLRDLIDTFMEGGK